MNENLPNKTLFVYSMTPDVALLFYQIAEDFGLDTEEERGALLAYLASEGLMTSVYQTKRTRAQVVADYKKHFNVLEIGAKNETDFTSN